jgi:hypothetical protein
MNHFSCGSISLPKRIAGKVGSLLIPPVADHTNAHTSNQEPGGSLPLPGGTRFQPVWVCSKVDEDMDG